MACPCGDGRTVTSLDTYRSGAAAGTRSDTPQRSAADFHALFERLVEYGLFYVIACPFATLIGASERARKGRQNAPHQTLRYVSNGHDSEASDPSTELSHF